ncbi:hypothetical protein WJX72_004383 [[Myrmecia] bisecta]|uniref:Uncharacterized protein n=1 Tax=[Myrmecia] bisecta TaxID=41462 RepID=A0AAW1QQ66_9CHLO
MDPRPDYDKDSYKGTGKLKDKVAIITGGDSGIGRAVALAYAREEDAICKRIVDETVKKWGRVDILINNAAIQDKAVGEFTDIPRERMERTFKVNIIAMFRLSQLAYPHMTKGGAIINTASVQAYKPSPAILDYASTKGAIVAFTKGLAQALISEGIRVNAVAPGPVWTPLIVESFPEDKVEHFGENYPIGRPAQPWELAPAYVFLASEHDSSYIAGEILAVTVAAGASEATRLAALENDMAVAAPEHPPEGPLIRSADCNLR